MSLFFPSCCGVEVKTWFSSSIFVQRAQVPKSDQKCLKPLNRVEVLFFVLGLGRVVGNVMHAFALSARRQT